MTDIIHPSAPPAETLQPSWLQEPSSVLSAMLDDGMLMFHSTGGPYLLSDPRNMAATVFVSDSTVNFLLERGWLTRVDDAPRGAQLYLLTAEGRRVALKHPGRP